MQFFAVWDSFIRLHKHNLIMLVGKAKDQNFRNKRANLFWSKVHDRYDLFANEYVLLIKMSDLGRAFFLANFRSKINRQLKSGFFGLWEVLCTYYCSNSYIYFRKI